MGAYQSKGLNVFNHRVLIEDVQETSATAKRLHISANQVRIENQTRVFRALAYVHEHGLGGYYRMQDGFHEYMCFEDEDTAALFTMMFVLGDGDDDEIPELRER